MELTTENIKKRVNDFLIKSRKTILPVNLVINSKEVEEELEQGFCIKHPCARVWFKEKSIFIEGLRIIRSDDIEKGAWFVC